MKNNRLIKIYSYESKKISYFSKILKKEITKRNKKFNGNLSEIHKYINDNEINSLRLSAFNQINKKNWISKIKEIALTKLKENLGADLLIQSKINLSIQMPNDESSILPAHSDSWSSDTPFQLNLWIPLTNTYHTNSMFVYSPNYSIRIFNKINQDRNTKIKKPNKKDFIKLKPGEFVLFNPACLHGNIKNTTKTTRVSLNVRFKSIFSPEPNEYHRDRKFGTYYKIFNMSENSKFAIKVIDTGMLS